MNPILGNELQKAPQSPWGLILVTTAITLLAFYIAGWLIECSFEIKYKRHPPTLVEYTKKSLLATLNILKNLKLK